MLAEGELMIHPPLRRLWAAHQVGRAAVCRALSVPRGGRGLWKCGPFLESTSCMACSAPELLGWSLRGGTLRPGLLSLKHVSAWVPKSLD